MTANKSQNRNEWLARIKAFGKWLGVVQQPFIRMGWLLAFAVVAAGLVAVWTCAPWLAKLIAPVQCGPELAKFLAYLVGGGFLLWQISAASRRATAMEQTAKATQQTADLTERGNIAERFKTAIEQFGSDSATIRLGGIYALHHIAATTKDYAETENYRERVFEMLCAYVRETTTAEGYQPRKDRGGRTVMAYESNLQVQSSGLNRLFPEARVTPTLEIQTILDLLFVKGASVYTGLTADLTDANLVGANLQKAQLPGALLDGAVLAHSCLNGANLYKGQLYYADLQHALMRETDLRNTSLGSADLRGVHARNASLEGADLREADLYSANLGCNLLNCELREVNLGSAHLKSAKNLTLDQLRRVRSLNASSLPDYLKAELTKLNERDPRLFSRESVQDFYDRRDESLDWDLW